MIERLPILVVAADGPPSIEIVRVARAAGCNPILCDDRASARRALIANRLFVAVVEIGSSLDSAADLCSWLRQQPGGRQIRIVVCTPREPLDLLPLIDAGADDIASYQEPGQTLGRRLAVAKARLLSEHRETPFDDPTGGMGSDSNRPHLLPHELLTRIRQMVWDETDLHRLYRSFVDGAAAAFGFSQISIYLVDGPSLVLEHLVGIDRMVDRIPFDRGIIGRTARTGRPVVLEDVTKDPDFIGGVAGLTSEICVPFHANGDVIGVINIESVDDVTLDDRDLPLVLALRDHLEAAIARISTFDRLRERKAQLRARFLALPAGLFTLNRTLDIVEINPFGAALFARPVAELIDQPLVSLVEPSLKPRLQQLTRQLLAGHLAVADFASDRGDGHTLSIALAAMPGGQSFAGTVADITSRRETEARLATRETLLDEIAAGGTTIGRIDAAGTIELITAGLEIPGITRRAGETIDLPAIVDSRDRRLLQNALNDPAAKPATLRLRVGAGAWIDLTLAASAPETGRLAILREAGTAAEREHRLTTLLGRYQPSFDNPIAPSAVIDTSGRFTVVSESLATLLGYSVEELRGLAFQQLTYPEDVEATMTSFRQLVSGEIADCTARRRFFHHDGHALPMLVRTIAIGDDTGTGVEFLMTVITLEREAELERDFNDVHGRYDSLVNDLPIITFTSPREVADTLNLFFSPQVEAMLGYPIEYLTHDIDRFYEFIHPEDRARIDAADDLAEAESDAFDETYRFIRGDGSTVWLRSQSVPIFREGDEASYWQGIMTDVTALKHSELQAIEREAWLRDLLANAPFLIATLDRNAAILSINDAVERLLGFNPRDLVSGRLVLGIHPDDRDRLRTRFTETLEQPGAAGTVETRFKHRDGHWVRFRLDVMHRQEAASPERMLVYGLPIE